MEILVISDIHNDIENIINFSDKLQQIPFDVVVCPGDFTDYNLPKGFTRRDIVALIVEELNTFGKSVLAVPGNMDGEIVSLLEEENVSLHGKGKIIKDVGFYGFGGAKTPFQTSLEPSEEELKNGLTRAFESVKKAKFFVQVTHSPPLNTKLDTLYTGAHVGSDVVRKFIEEKHPAAAISSHVLEARGVDQIGNTKLINSGRFPEGYVGLISLKQEKTEAKIVSLL